MARTPTFPAPVVHALAAISLAATVAAIAAPASAQTYYLAENDGRGRAVQVETGYYHMCVLTHCGGIECGGGNWWGEGWAPDDRDFIDVAAGVMHSCGLHEDGTAECWGDNSYGQLEVPEDEVLTSIDGGWYHTCGVTEDQRVVCWGDDTYGQLTPHPADGSERFLSVEAGAAFTCATVEYSAWATRVVCWGMDDHGQMDYPAGAYDGGIALLDYEQPTAGYGHGCAVDGYYSVPVCWGMDNHEQVSTDAPPQSYGQYHDSYTEHVDGAVVLWGTRVTDISAGTIHTCAVRDDGQLLCWGDGSFYQAAPPAGVFTQVSAGNHTSCAIDEDGHLQCWGDSMYESLSLPDLSYVCADNLVEDGGWNYYWWWF